MRCDFSEVHLEQVGRDRVRVSGARGNPPTDTYKLCITYDDGWRAIAYQPLIGEEASAAKAERQATALFNRARVLLRARKLADFTATSVIVIGAERSFGAHAQPGGGREIIAKLVADHPEKIGADLFAREQWTAVSGMSVGTSINLATQVLPVTGLFLCLLTRPLSCRGRRSAGEGRRSCRMPRDGRAIVPRHARHRVPARPARGPCGGLMRMAFVRSGDKGHLFNVAVIARRSQYLPWLRAALHLRRWDSDTGTCAPGPPRVERHEVPGFDALNFVVHDRSRAGLTPARSWILPPRAWARCCCASRWGCPRSSPHAGRQSA